VWPAVCAHAANNSFPGSDMFQDTSWWASKGADVVATALLGVVVVCLVRRRPAALPRYDEAMGAAG
jgi:hypothetical protein